MVKKTIALCLLLSLSCLVLPLSVVNATSTSVNKTTDIDVGFEEAGSEPLPKPKPPLIDGGGNNNPGKLLPQTGEIITSMIIMLIGVSLVMFISGVLICRRLYRELSWEYRI